MKLKGVSITLIIKDGKVLIGRRRDTGKFTVPGGHLNEGEDPKVGAARELEEESGIKINPSILKKTKEVEIIKKGIRIFAYKATVPSDTKTTVGDDPDAEVKRWQWVKLPLDDKTIDDMCIPREDNVFLEYLEGSKKFASFIAGFEKRANAIHEVVEEAIQSIPKWQHMTPTQAEAIKKATPAVIKKFGRNGWERLLSLVKKFHSDGHDVMKERYSKTLFKNFINHPNKDSALSHLVDQINPMTNKFTVPVISGQEFAQKINFLTGSGLNEFSLSKMAVHGGLADGMKDDEFPKDQLSMGKKVELEHTDNKDLAKEIAKDHLAEDEEYYSKLKKMEKNSFFIGFKRARRV